MEAGVQGQSHLLLSSPHRHPSLAGPQRHPLAAPTSATQHSLSLDSSVFGLVVDACTDFKTSGGITGDKTQDTSPQQSYRLTPTPPETPEDINPTPTSTPTPNTNPGSLPPSPSLTRKFLYGLLDTHLGSSDGSLVSGGGGRHNSLAVAGVHRFGSRVPCAGSPHDLASCPAPPPSLPTHPLIRQTKERRSVITKEGDAGPSSVAGRSDALKTLTETSTALALTETLIGPLRLPPIPPGVLHEVLSGMERRASPPPGTHRAGWGSRGSAVERDKVLLHTQEPGHRGLTNGAAAAAAGGGGGGGGGMIGETDSCGSSQRFIMPQDTAMEEVAGRGDGHEHRVVAVCGPEGEELRELHRYPAAAITTVVERKSYLGLDQAGTREPRRRRQRPRRRTASQTSLASECSTCASGSSTASLLGHSCAPSKASSRGSGGSDAPGPPRPLLSSAVRRARRALEGEDRGAVSPCPSDASSSNLSTLSDLSGYEEEYLTLRRLVSNAASPEDHHHHLSRLAAAPAPAQRSGPGVEELQRVVQEAVAQREDLEIAVHRLSVQVHNAVREKEVVQQQLELVQTQVTETGQRQCFEAQRQRAALEGRLETVQQELEAAVQLRTQMQGRLGGALAEAREAQAAAAQATEAQAVAMARMEKFEVANRCLEGEVKEARKGLDRAENELAKASQQAMDLQAKSEGQALAMEQLREAEALLRQEAQETRTRLAQLESQQAAMGKALGQADTALAKATAEARATQAEATRRQEQLQRAEEARTALQREALEARSALARMEAEKEAVEVRVESLSGEVEEGQARAVRDKSLLVSHLEALQADMAEREALLARLQQDHTAGSHLAQQRQQRLEEDRQRVQGLRLDLAEAERRLADAREDLRQRAGLLTRRETQLKEAKGAAAVGQEQLRERDGRITGLEQHLEELDHTASALREERVAGEARLAALQEENSRLVASLEVANQEKAEVDAAILKVREDMSRLTTSVYRMRHDLAAKDRRLQQMAGEAEEAARAKAALEERMASLHSKAHHEEEKTELRRKVEGLKEEVRVAGEARAGLEGELGTTRASLKAVETEKKALTETCRLQEEQIHSLEGGAESCREVMMRKEEELHRAGEQHTGLEEEYLALRRHWEALKGENLSLRQEAEACAEHEAAQRREQSDLKDSIQMERKLKQSLEHKLEAVSREYRGEQESAERTQVELVERLARAEGEATQRREEAERRGCLLEEEVKVGVQERERLQLTVESLKKTLDASKFILEEQTLTTQSLASKVEALERAKEGLEASVKGKTEEVARLEARHRQQQAGAERLAEEKERVATQVKALLAENTRLKKVQKTTDVLVSEAVNNNNNINNSMTAGGKMAKSPEILQKEVSTLSSRLEEAGRQRNAMQEALKSAKKESILMRAKSKELETLRSRCAQLEATVNQQRKSDVLVGKCAALEANMASRQKENISLAATLKEKEGSLEQERKKSMSLTAVLKEKDAALSLLQNRAHKESSLQARIGVLEAALQETQEATTTLKQQLKASEGERNTWAAKYDRLRDSIPERDSSTRPAIQLLPPPQHHGFTTTQEARQYSSDTTASSATTQDSSAHPSNIQEAIMCPGTSQQHLAHPTSTKEPIVLPSSSQEPVTHPLNNHESQTYSKSVQKLSVCPTSNQVSVERVGSTHESSSSIQKSYVYPNSSQDLHKDLGNGLHVSRVTTDSTTTTNTNNKVSGTQTVGSPPPCNTPQATTCHSNPVTATPGPWRHDREPQNSLLQPREEGDGIEAETGDQNLQSVEISSSSCHTRLEEEERTAERPGDEAGSRQERSISREEAQYIQHLEKISDLESLINTRESELQEEKEKSVVASNEFCEKQRRYESNVRLLTRKLKEHMKGRKAAEREVQSLAEEQQRAVNDEREKYETLRVRCLELEGAREVVEGQAGVLQGEVGEAKAALARSHQECHKHHTAILHLQKEVGRLQEICKAADGLRCVVSSLEVKLEEKEKLSSALERDLGAAREEVKEGRRECVSLSSSLDQLKGEKERLERELKDISGKLEKAQHNSKTQQEVNKKLQDDLTRLGGDKADLALRLGAAGAKCDQLQATKGYLEEAKKKLFSQEHQLKVLAGDLEVSVEEARQAREQQAVRERSVAGRVAGLEERLGAARREAESLAGQASQAKQERVSYQSQATQLRAALHSALEQLKSHESERQAREAQALTLTSEVEVIPSPRPLDIASLTQLIERSSVLPRSAPPPLTSLESCLSSLKAEVKVLQSRLQSSGGAQGETQGLPGQDREAPSEAAMAVTEMPPMPEPELRTNAEP